MKSTYRIALTVLLAFQCTRLPGEAEWDYSLPDTVRLTQRVNLSRRENGRYIGLTHSELQGHLSRDSAADAIYAGRVLLFEHTLRDMVSAAREIDASYPLELLVDPRAGVLAGLAFPAIQQVPELPARVPEIGALWDGQAVFFVNPTDERLFTPVNALIEYEYVGTELVGGVLYHVITANAATRFNRAASEEPLPGDPDLLRVVGMHTLGIRVPAQTGGSLLIRDQLDEQYQYTDGTVIRLTGHQLVFIDGIQATPQPVVDELAQEMGPQNIAVDQTNEGLRLTVRDIHFLPDQAVILPEERGRLDDLVVALRRFPAETRFLVVGHTARVGTELSQQELSVARARTIAAELAARGIERGRLMIEGRGGAEPVADNDTEDGRHRNRRVEIYVLQ